MQTEKDIDGLLEGPALTALKEKSPRWHQFAIALFKHGGRATEAARDCGYKESKNLKRRAWKLKHTPEIAAAVEELQTAWAHRAIVEANDALEEMARIALCDPKDLLGAEGEVLPLDKMPARVRRAIASFEVTKDAEGKITGYKVRFWSKTEALNMIARHLNMYSEDNSHQMRVTHEEALDQLDDDTPEKPALDS